MERVASVGATKAARDVEMGRRVRAGGLDGAAGAGAVGVEGGEGEGEGEGEREDLVGEREVGFGLGASEIPGGGVVGSGGLLRGVEGSEPDAALLGGIPNLGGVAPPWPLPHSPEMWLFVLNTFLHFLLQSHIVRRWET